MTTTPQKAPLSITKLITEARNAAEAHSAAHTEQAMVRAYRATQALACKLVRVVVARRVASLHPGVTTYDAITLTRNPAHARIRLKYVGAHIAHVLIEQAVRSGAEYPELYNIASKKTMLVFKQTKSTGAVMPTGLVRVFSISQFNKITEL